MNCNRSSSSISTESRCSLVEILYIKSLVAVFFLVSLFSADISLPLFLIGDSLSDKSVYDKGIVSNINFF